MPPKLAPKKEGDRMGRPRTGRTQFTIRLDPNATAILSDAGKLYRYCELIGLANYQNLSAPAKVIEMLLKQHTEEWIRETLKRLNGGGLPEEVLDRLYREFKRHWAG